jgi:hypothetical protein
MSGGGGKGAQPNIDIVTTNVTHDTATQKTTRQSDVAVTIPVAGPSPFVIGIMVKNNQASTATLAITNPPGMNPVKQPLNGAEAIKLKTALKPLAGHRWVVFEGTVPAGPPAPLNLQTELVVNSSQVVKHGFQVVPVVAQHKGDDWKNNIYLIGASIIPGQPETAKMLRVARGRGEAPGMQAPKRSKPAKKKR